MNGQRSQPPRPERRPPPPPPRPSGAGQAIVPQNVFNAFLNYYNVSRPQASNRPLGPQAAARWAVPVPAALQLSPPHLAPPRPTSSPQVAASSGFVITACNASIACGANQPTGPGTDYACQKASSCLRRTHWHHLFVEPAGPAPATNPTLPPITQIVLPANAPASLRTAARAALQRLYPSINITLAGGAVAPLPTSYLMVRRLLACLSLGCSGCPCAGPPQAAGSFHPTQPDSICCLPCTRCRRTAPRSPASPPPPASWPAPPSAPSTPRRPGAHACLLARCGAVRGPGEWRLRLLYGPALEAFQVPMRPD